MRGRYRWMIGSLMALAMPGAWAGGGQINFTGAVVEPTCAIDAAAADPASGLLPVAVQAPRHLTCGRTATDSGRAYSRTVFTLDATGVANDRLLSYFASYAAPVGHGGAGAILVVRTYD